LSPMENKGTLIVLSCCSLLRSFLSFKLFLAAS
jgi:hypothetical protein